VPQSSFQKQLLEYVTAAEEQGWEVTHSRRHWKFCPKDKHKRIVYIATSPSDHRVMKNMRAELRRSGLNLD
jgi:hypothetical protein